MGKSEGNPIWLNPELTPPSAYSAFLEKTPDTIVEKYKKKKMSSLSFLNLIRFLHLLTLMEEDEIKKIMTEHNASPESKFAQSILAKEATKIIHPEPNTNPNKKEKEL